MAERRAEVIVWDLDETLCHSFFEDNKQSEKNNRFYKFKLKAIKDDTKYDNVWGIERKYAREVIKKFHIGGFMQIVWSAGEYHYVHALVNILFHSIGVKPFAILTRNDCDDIYNIVEEEATKVKNMTKLWDMFPNIVTPRNTIMIDDRLDVCMYNANNHIEVPAWKPKMNNLYEEDTVLVKVYNHIIKHSGFCDARIISSIPIMFDN